MLYFDTHTHTISLKENVFSIVNTYPNSTNFSTPFSIGIHPWFIVENEIKDALLLVEEKLMHKNCVALGECGLDKLSEIELEIQKSVFKKHILLSEKYKKPIIIHCVKAFQEIIEFRKEMKPTQVWILHGFHKNAQVAKSLIKNGFMLSFGAAIINNKKLQEVICELPISSIVLETDTSELSIQEIYQKLAVVKGENLSEIKETISTNFKKIFKI